MLRDFGGHPLPLESISYASLSGFHGGNTGSNPVGDANILDGLTPIPEIPTPSDTVQ
jgi:hypothetical protein